MSERPAAVADAKPHPTPTTPSTRRSRLRITLRLSAVAAGLAAPLYADVFWLQLALFAFAAVVATLGLTMLLGQAGQLSLGHAFFAAVGAYGYTVLAGQPKSTGSIQQIGLGLPPVIAAALAACLAGLAGVLFSPIAARLRGIYLGIASLALVFLGEHLLFNTPALSGGVNGRDVPIFTLAGIQFDDNPDATLYIAGVPFGREARLWYLGLAVVVAAYLFYRNLIRARPGRALRALRDRELMAGVMGVPVTVYKARVFAVSSAYAGVGGVLLALAYGRVVPDTFSVKLSVAYLAMAVIGGLGSASGAVAGATFVATLPAIFERYTDVIPGLAAAGSGGLTPSVAATLLYGAAIVALLLIEPGGVAACAARVQRRLAARRQVTVNHPNH
ncbi:branched-chain amino acid ABC transporter permease [Dactylosporangium maewongense]|uniref:Branched-chain amino acid ABC transporter permease n=1 Tax=Dactylosporangium maewongense TaxID=634393 RepID=A0ABP4PEZ3_9ACTN